MTRNRVLLTGATGNAGTHALKSLLDQHRRPVRALVRAPGRLGWAVGAGADLVQGDMNDSEALGHAMDCVHTLILITPAGPDAAEQANLAVSVAQQADVQKIVRLSAIKAAEDGPTDNSRQHAITERTIRDSGMRYVFLRPNYFMQNLLGGLGTIVGEGKLYAGMGDARIGFVDARDVGEALAAAALTDAFDGSTLELSGPGSIGHDEVATQIGEALGRRVDYIPVPPEAAGSAARAFGLDEWTVQLIVDYCHAYANGFGDFVTDSVQALTGRDPRDIATFAREVLAPMASAHAPGRSDR